MVSGVRFESPKNENFTAKTAEVKVLPPTREGYQGGRKQDWMEAAR
jgi:hypothetical protein